MDDVIQSILRDREDARFHERIRGYVQTLVSAGQKDKRLLTA